MIGRHSTSSKMIRDALTTYLMWSTLFGVRFSESKQINEIFQGTWDGIALYLATDRLTLQEKLDTYYSLHQIYNTGDNTTKLYLPENPVFPGKLTAEQHPVYIDFSRVTSFDLQEHLRDRPDSCLSASRMEVAISIPLLAREPSGPPLYALGIAIFYERNRKDFPTTNVLYPYIPVDEITMDDNCVVVKNGNDEIRATFIKYDHPCHPPPKVVRNEIAELIDGDLHFGLPEPDVSICDRHRSLNERFCSFAEKFGADFHLNAPNICEKWNNFGRIICKASTEITNMTSGFRDLILLNDGPINVIDSEVYNGDSTTALIWPCIESGID